MSKMLTKLLCVTLTSLLFLNPNILAKGTSKQIKQLHTKISNNLLGIRKAYPKSQLAVYSVLDQVCKMYSLSKKVLSKKKNLKKQLAVKEKERNSFRVKIFSLKNKILKMEKELGKTKNNFELTNKNLEEKDSLLALLNKEKIDLLTEKRQLQARNHALTIKIKELQNESGNKQDLNPNETSDKESLYLNKIYNPKMKQRKNRLQNKNQSLNLTSTSDPISPL